MEITLETKIKAPLLRVFNLSRDIGFHTQTASHTHEEAISGVTSGLIEFNETVTWRGRHFGLYLKHTSKITAMDKPHFFVDEMIEGLFKSFRHEHYFKKVDELVIMTDHLSFRSPLGPIGSLIDRWVLKPYLSRFLQRRNAVIKQYAEHGSL